MPAADCDGFTCCLGCLSLVPGLRRKIVNRIAFSPPRPPAYWIHQQDNDVLHKLSTSPIESVIQNSRGPASIWPDPFCCCPSSNDDLPVVSWSSPTPAYEHRPPISTNPLPENSSGELSNAKTYGFPKTKIAFLCNGNYQRMPTVEYCTDATISVETVELVTAEKNTIWAFYFTRADAQRKTILFSHGSATDIGVMHSHLLDLCRTLRVDVFGYEYTGYGCSTGEASEISLNRDIEAAFQHLTEDRGVCPMNIILYGHSVGSAPTLDLASKLHIGGVVLQGAFKSGLSVLRDDASTTTTCWFDAFRNVDKIRKVRSPVFIIHGTEDTEVKWENGKALYDAALDPEPPWWVEGAGHNDIEVYWRDEYLERLRHFISSTQSGSHSDSQMGTSGQQSLIPSIPHMNRSPPEARSSSLSSFSLRKKAASPVSPDSSSPNQLPEPSWKTQGSGGGAVEDAECSTVNTSSGSTQTTLWSRCSTAVSRYARSATLGNFVRNGGRYALLTNSRHPGRASSRLPRRKACPSAGSASGCRSHGVLTLRKKESCMEGARAKPIASRMKMVGLSEDSPMVQFGRKSSVQAFCTTATPNITIQTVPQKSISTQHHLPQKGSLPPPTADPRSPSHFHSVL